MGFWSHLKGEYAKVKPKPLISLTEEDKAQLRAARKKAYIEARLRVEAERGRNLALPRKVNSPMDDLGRALFGSGNPKKDKDTIDKIMKM